MYQLPNEFLLITNMLMTTSPLIHFVSITQLRTPNVIKLTVDISEKHIIGKLKPELFAVSIFFIILL